MKQMDIPSWTLDVARSIMLTVKAKDDDTYNHCVRVSQGTSLLAKAMGLNNFEQKIAEFAGLFHDVGKVGVPDAILLKPSKLTDEEFNVMKSHPERSVEILAPLAHVSFFEQLIPGIRHHHERYDGRGYPEGVFGEEIPLVARIILVIDTYDAMTTSRVYRKGLPSEVAYQELKDHAGGQFDAHVVKTFLQAHPTWGRQDLRMFRDTNNTVLRVQAA